MSLVDSQLAGVKNIAQRFAALSKEYSSVARQMEEVERNLMRLLNSGRVFNRGMFDSIVMEMRIKLEPIEMLSKNIGTFMDQVLTTIIQNIGSDRKISLLEEKVSLMNLLNSRSRDDTALTVEDINTEPKGTIRREFNDGLYIGEMKDDKRHGKGEFYHRSGSYCIGQFVDNVFQGEGRFYWNNGDIYKGNFVNGSFSGRGVLFMHNGEIYEGDFLEDLPHGQGMYYYTDDSRFSGYFVKGKKHGLGARFYPSSDRYEGNYYKDVRDGRGFYYYADGSKELMVFERGVLKHREKV